MFMFGLGIILLISYSVVSSCTQNSRVKSFGGEMTVEIERGQKLVNVTWKNNEMWVLTRPMTSEDKLEIYYFTEKSSFGVMEGKVTFVEQR